MAQWMISANVTTSESTQDWVKLVSLPPAAGTSCSSLLPLLTALLCSLSHASCFVYRGDEDSRRVFKENYDKYTDQQQLGFFLRSWFFKMETSWLETFQVTKMLWATQKVCPLGLVFSLSHRRSQDLGLEYSCAGFANPCNRVTAAWNIIII